MGKGTAKDRGNVFSSLSISFPSFFTLFILSLQIQLIFSQFACYQAPGVGEDRRVDKNKLVVAQYNCEWLFLGDSSTCPGMCPWTTEEEQNAHFDNILNEIRLIDADIINIAEVENCDVLELLAERLDSGYKAYLVQGTDTATNQNVGILTRIDPIVNLQRTETTCSYPLPGSTCGETTKEGNKSVTKHYYTKFLINNEEVIMMGMHLLSNPTSAPNCVQREGQACVLSNYLDDIISSEEDKNSLNIILIGDMNDYDSSVPDSSNHHPTSRVLEILRNGVNSVDESKGTQRTFQLTNPGSLELNITNRYSCWYDYYDNCLDNGADDLSIIDHLLLSPRMMERAEEINYYHNYPNGCDNNYSDHWPVIVTFNWPSDDNNNPPPDNNYYSYLNTFFYYYSQLYSSDYSQITSISTVDNTNGVSDNNNDDYSTIKKYYYYSTEEEEEEEFIGIGIAIGIAISIIFCVGFVICAIILVAVVIFLKKRKLIGRSHQNSVKDLNINDDDIFPPVDTS